MALKRDWFATVAQAIVDEVGRPSPDTHLTLQHSMRDHQHSAQCRRELIPRLEKIAQQQLQEMVRNWEASSKQTSEMLRQEAEWHEQQAQILLYQMQQHVPEAERPSKMRKKLDRLQRVGEELFDQCTKLDQALKMSNRTVDEDAKLMSDWKKMFQLSESKRCAETFTRKLQTQMHDKKNFQQAANIAENASLQEMRDDLRRVKSMMASEHIEHSTMGDDVRL